MKQNYKLNQPILAYVLLISLFLPSCSSLKNSFISNSNEEGQATITPYLLTDGHPSRDSEETTALDDSPILPVELLQLILAYVAYPYILDCRRINRSFYEFITGYTQVGVVGVANKPTSFFYSPSWINDKAIVFREDKYEQLTPETTSSFSFNRLMERVVNLSSSFWSYIQGTQNFEESKLNRLLPETIPSFFFYRLMGKAVNLPVSFWPYIQDTQVHVLDLSHNDLGTEGISELAKVLSGTQVHILNLGHTGLRAKGIIELVKALPGSQVQSLYLAKNKIKDEEAIELAKRLVLTLY